MGAFVTLGVRPVLPVVYARRWVNTTSSVYSDMVDEAGAAQNTCLLGTCSFIQFILRGMHVLNIGKPELNE